MPTRLFAECSDGRVEQFIGQEPAVATLPEDYPKSTEEFQELLDGKRDYYWDERRYVRTNGEIFWAHVTMSVVRDEYRYTVVHGRDGHRHR